MKIKDIRSIIESANWSRMDATGGTPEENARVDLPARLNPIRERLVQLPIPPRFVRDIQNRNDAVERIDTVIARWQANKGIIPFPGSNI